MSDRLSQIKRLVRSYPDFPKKGIVFRDLFPVMRNPLVFRHMIDLMCEHIRLYANDVDIIAGLESRGFLLAPMVAEQLQKPFVPVRKAGKLPGKCQMVTYNLEYGTDKFEAQEDSVHRGNKVVIVDDLLATGGSMKAAVGLMDCLGAEVIGCLVVIELLHLKGREIVTPCVHSLIHY